MTLYGRAFANRVGLQAVEDGIGCTCFAF